MPADWESDLRFLGSLSHACTVVKNAAHARILFRRNIAAIGSVEVIIEAFSFLRALVPANLVALVSMLNTINACHTDYSRG